MTHVSLRGKQVLFVLLASPLLTILLIKLLLWWFHF